MMQDATMAWENRAGTKLDDANFNGIGFTSFRVCDSGRNRAQFASPLSKLLLKYCELSTVKKQPPEQSIVKGYGA